MKSNNIYGLLGLARRAGKLSFGTESCIQAIEKRNAKLVILAENASDRTKKNFKELCKKQNIPIYIIETIENLSRSIGQVNKAVITIQEENFAKELIKRINGGEIIG